MDAQLFLSFALASFLMALMPGPDNILVVTESIAKGIKNGVLLALGMNLGVIVHTTLAATGLTIILQQSALAFLIIQYVGAAYLLYLAYKTIREKVTIHVSKKIDLKGNFQVVKTGFLMNVLNPKVSLFFIAFLPQFVRAEEGRVAVQMLLLGSLFMIIGFLTFGGFALLAAQLRKPLNNLKFMNAVKWGKVIVLVGLAVYLLIP